MIFGNKIEHLKYQIGGSLAVTILALFSGMSMLLLSFLVSVFGMVVLVEVFNHRYVTHRSYKLHRWLENTLIILSTVVTGTGSPIGWSMVHMAHHKYSDTTRDPHSPVYLKFKDAITLSYTNLEDCRYVRKFFSQNRLYLTSLRYYKLLALAWFSLIFLVFGLEVAIFGVLTPWVGVAIYSVLFARWLHTPSMLGNYRNHDLKDLSQNSWLVQLFSFGSLGLHNNHHKKPRSTTCVEKWFEFDTASWIIRLIKTN